MRLDKLAAVSAIALFFFALQANANTTCSGKISYLGVDNGGQVIVANGGGINTICNSNIQSIFQTNPYACRMIYATLLAAKATGQSATIFYNDPNLTSCTQIGNWTTQTSVYFVVQDVP